MPRTNSDRARLFWMFCLPARGGLIVAAYAVAHWDAEPAQLAFAALALVAATGLLVNWYQYKQVGGLGGDAWWHPVRPAHALVYIVYASLVFGGVAKAWIVLIADVALAILFWAALSPTLNQTPFEVMLGPCCNR